MTSHARVLLVDAHGPDVTSHQHLLAAAGYETVHAADADAAAEQVDGVDVVLVALDAVGLRGVTRLANASAGVQTIALVGEGGSAAGREALRLGAVDVVRRTDDAEAMLFAVERAVRARRLLTEVTMLRARVGDRLTQALIGRSSAMVAVRELIGRAAASRRTVLISGEAGTGKDVVARLVHELSDLADRPYVTVRCAGVDDATLERDLFGERTSGGVATAGLIERARGGTLVLDEIAGIGAKLRERIEQLVAQRAVPTAGDASLVAVDVRLIVTTRDVDVARPTRGTDQRTGLANLFPITVPPLRERRSDIPLLVQHFRARLTRELGIPALPPVSPDAMMRLIAQSWPGNVRELEHVIERSAHEPAGPTTTPATGAAFDDGPTLEELERRYILHVLDREQGHQSRAAERLGIDRRTLYRKLKQYKVEGDDRREATS